VSRSQREMVISASLAELPHMSTAGCNPTQVLGRSGLPNRTQPKAASKCGQCSPAALPLGKAGTEGEIDGAMQQAAQLTRHCIIVECKS
jgi:hypothetical protein